MCSAARPNEHKRDEIQFRVAHSRQCVPCMDCYPSLTRQAVRYVYVTPSLTRQAVCKVCGALPVTYTGGGASSVWGQCYVGW